MKRSPGCSINIVRPNPLMSAQEALHPGTQPQKHTCSLMYYDLPAEGAKIQLSIHSQLHPVSHFLPSEIQHVRNCPIDCASIYYNGVRRSGLYTVVPSLAGMAVEVYCDMDIDGESHTCRQMQKFGWISRILAHVLVGSHTLCFLAPVFFLLPRSEQE